MNASSQGLVISGGGVGSSWENLTSVLVFSLLLFLSSSHSLIHLSSATRHTRRTCSLDASPWTFNLPASRTLRRKFLLFCNCLVSDICGQTVYSDAVLTFDVLCGQRAGFHGTGTRQHSLDLVNKGWSPI